ncbi:MAG TPA: glycosyltransferase family 2 protein [Oligoflexia bacterium]|nr:glycosyltransferase family 2 protein [Oligoflexia bacterium]HMP27750.1 glycosyltransferase family 2 protein [Oligoflexia bacterium]
MIEPISGISIVIPVYNEELNVVASYREVRGVLDCFGRPYEIIFVDDGSRDKTLENLLAVGGSDPALRIVQLRRNFGQTAAMAAGFEYARYDGVVALDGDLQNDPNEIPKMIAKLEEGYDLVAGWRKKRQDRWLSRKLPSRCANWLISKVTGVKLHDYGCTLKAMRSEIAKGINLYGEMHRFIPALANEVGARIAEVPVNHRPRLFGKTKYGISRTIRVFLDLITVKFLLRYSKRPIHLFGVLGLVSFAAGLLAIAHTTYQRFFMAIPMGNRPLFVLGVMMVLVGLQFLVFGLLAEVLARTYHESQDRRIFAVRRVYERFPNVEPMTVPVNSVWRRSA